MNKKIKPEIDKIKLGTNPFIVNQVIKARSFNREEHLLVKQSEGINLPFGEVKTAMLVEEQKYTKVYHDVDFRDILLLLDEYPLKLVLFIMYQINVNEDYVWINSRLFQDKTKLRDKRDYITALETLIRYGVLSPTIYKDVYWINPLIFFAGNRLHKYPNHLSIR